MEYAYTIFGELPTLNEEIDAAKTHYHVYRNHKKTHTNTCRWDAAHQLGNIEINACAIICTWYRRTARTDPDNVSFGIKYILDGLQQAGILSNDGWRQTSGGILHRFGIDKDNPRVEVRLLVGKNLSI